MALSRSILVISLAAIAIISQAVWAQQSVSVDEKAAADAVAKFVERARAQSGLPKLRRIKDRYLRPDACRRARRGETSVGRSAGIGPPEKVGMLSALWYSTLDPDRPPAELLEWAKGPARQYEQPHRFAVGVCVVSAAKDSERQYWIDVGTYMSAIKSLLNVPTWD